MSKGVEAGIINGSGDINSRGSQPGGKLRVVGISDPFHRGDIYAIVPLFEYRGADTFCIPDNSRTSVNDNDRESYPEKS